MTKISKRALMASAFVAISVAFYAFIIISEYKPANATAYEAAINTEITAGNKKDIPQPGLERARIALGEYKKNIKEKTPNCNCGEDIDKYTEGLRIQWCASFASWVSKQAGSPLNSGKGWRIGKAQDIARYLEKNGTWVSAQDAKTKNIQPQVGDIVIFWRGHFEDNLGHADIVISTNPSEPGQATLIGGNIQNKVSLRENFYYSEHYGFLGFGRPEK